ncbi:hypothetical protein AKO1_003001 [Acrasis kona]|uniref:Uncharacterized protein n=1 Tax=Acrasis kona TaxID=1008807 RepID=A0AAW2ZM30_9EUKA
MGFWLSDLIVSTTLFVNAAAVINFTISNATTEDHFVEEGETEMRGISAQKTTIGDTVKQVLTDLRTLR